MPNSALDPMFVQNGILGTFCLDLAALGLLPLLWKLTVFSVSGFLLLYFPLICCFPSIFIAWALDLK